MERGDSKNLDFVLAELPDFDADLFEIGALPSRSSESETLDFFGPVDVVPVELPALDAGLLEVGAPLTSRSYESETLDFVPMDFSLVDVVPLFEPPDVSHRDLLEVGAPEAATPEAPSLPSTADAEIADVGFLDLAADRRRSRRVPGDIEPCRSTVNVPTVADLDVDDEEP